MIVGNCCHSCQRHSAPTKSTTTTAAASSSSPSLRTGAALSTGFRRADAAAAAAGPRRVRFEAPGLPQRLRASAVGLARAAASAAATPELNNALSGLASRGPSKPTAGLVSQQYYGGGGGTLSGRPYWEHESCTSTAYGGHPHTASSATFRSSYQPADAAAQSAFDSFAAQRPSSAARLDGEASQRHEWKAEFLTAASDATTSSPDKNSTIADAAQAPSWDGELRSTVNELLPAAGKLLDDLAPQQAKPSTFDANTIKRLRMILQHLAFTSSAPSLQSRGGKGATESGPEPLPC